MHHYGGTLDELVYGPINLCWGASQLGYNTALDKVGLGLQFYQV